MNTVPADERLSAYLDGELTDAETAAFETELHRDAGLQAQLDALTIVVRTLGDDGPMRAPLGFHAAVMDRIDAEHPPVSWWESFARRPFGIPQQGWGVMLAAAAVLLVVQVGRGRDEAVVSDDDPVWREVGEAPAAAKLRGLQVEEGPPIAQDPAPQAKIASKEPPVPAADAKANPGEGANKPNPKAEKLNSDADSEPRKLGTTEQAGTDSDDPVLRAPPSGFTFYTSDPSSLREVLALVGKHGGSITAPDGSAITTAVLEHSEQSVVLRIPSNRLAAFQKDLGRLGNVKATFDADKLYGGSEITVPMTFHLTGGGESDAEKMMAPAPDPASDLK